MEKISVLFVCLGNICRSPTAHAVFEAKVRAAGLDQHIVIDSAGTGDWHIGVAPDKRATAAASGRGYDMTPLRARQVQHDDFERFDYILAMDSQNFTDLKRLAPRQFDGHLSLFLDFHPQVSSRDVPDPYYGSDDGFNQVLDLVEVTSDALLVHLRSAHGF